MTKLDKDFYLRDTVTVARELLGCRLVRILNGTRLEMTVTETEAYCGINDRACHSFGGRRTARTETMYREGGIAYVYLIYGMYNCLNAVTEAEGSPCAVLIRGAVPEGDTDALSLNRYGVPFGELNGYRRAHFGDGPGKICLAMGIDRALNGANLTGDILFVEKGARPPCIKEGKRINIGYAREAKDYLWRFYL